MNPSPQQSDPLTNTTDNSANDLVHYNDAVPHISFIAMVIILVILIPPLIILVVKRCCFSRSSGTRRNAGDLPITRADTVQLQLTEKKEARIPVAVIDPDETINVAFVEEGKKVQEETARNEDKESNLEDGGKQEGAPPLWTATMP